MKEYKTSNAVKHYLLSINETFIGWGHAGHLDDVYDIINPNFTNTHAMDKWKIVLNGLDRDIRRGCDIFDKSFVNIYGRSCRVFTIRNSRPTND